MKISFNFLTILILMMVPIQGHADSDAPILSIPMVNNLVSYNLEMDKQEPESSYQLTNRSNSESWQPPIGYFDFKNGTIVYVTDEQKVFSYVIATGEQRFLFGPASKISNFVVPPGYFYVNRIKLSDNAKYFSFHSLITSKPYNICHLGVFDLTSNREIFSREVPANGFRNTCDEGQIAFTPGSQSFIHLAHGKGGPLELRSLADETPLLSSVTLPIESAADDIEKPTNNDHRLTDRAHYYEIFRVTQNKLIISDCITHTFRYFSLESLTPLEVAPYPFTNDGTIYNNDVTAVISPAGREDDIFHFTVTHLKSGLKTPHAVQLPHSIIQFKLTNNPDLIVIEGHDNGLKTTFILYQLSTASEINRLWFDENMVGYRSLIRS